jgi:hypothetical protein
MKIDRRLHEAGHQWRQSQGPALPAPKLDTPLQKTPPRRWMTGLIPLAASAAVAAMVIGVVVLHDAPASHQVPEGSTNTSSPTSSPTPAPTASTPAQASSTVTAPQPSTAVASPSVAGKGAAVAPNPTSTGSPTKTTTTAGPLSAVSTPRSGVLGHVTILATATLAGIPATETGQLEFDVSPGPYNQGQPASAEAVPTHGPGLYTMPTGYAPDRSGNWFVTVVYVPSPSQGTGPVPRVSGMPAPNNPHPDANLVTVVTAS